MNFLQSVTPFVIAVGFLFFILGYTLYSIYAVHHLNEFGYSGDSSQLMLRFYIGFTSVIILLTLGLLLLGFLTL